MQKTKNKIMIWLVIIGLLFIGLNYLLYLHTGIEDGSLSFLGAISIGGAVALAMN